MDMKGLQIYIYIQQRNLPVKGVFPFDVVVCGGNWN